MNVNEIIVAMILKQKTLKNKMLKKIKCIEKKE